MSDSHWIRSPEYPQKWHSFLDEGSWNELCEKGVVALPSFYSADQCRGLIQELKKTYAQFPSFVVSDKLGSDARLMGAENGGPLASEFNRDPRLKGVAASYFGGELEFPLTLSGHLTYKEGNLGSGQGWHRDSVRKQFKTIVYLADVGPQNGPFQYVIGSHRAAKTWLDFQRASLLNNQRRLSEEEIGRVLQPNRDRLREFTGALGTVLLVDTSGIHRGKPIEEGERWALTNYYFSKAKFDRQIEHFRPILGR